jgi:hypothetical protein
MQRVLLGIVLGFFSAVCAAQKFPVIVRHSGDDSVGKLYAYEFRELVRGSHGMRLITEDAYLHPHIRVDVVSHDSSVGAAGQRSALAATIVYDALDIPMRGVLIAAYVQTCGSSRAAECAKSLLVEVDQGITSLNATPGGPGQELYKKLRHNR